MRSRIFESEFVRHNLLSIFSSCHGDKGTFSTNNLGLWGVFLKNIQVDHHRFKHIQHTLLECSFLNVSCELNQADSLLSSIRYDESVHSSGDCIMVPCLRESDNQCLLQQGFVCIPSFFSCKSYLTEGWESKLQQSMSKKHFKDFKREIRRVEEVYETKWINLKELIHEQELFKRSCDIYMQNAAKFESSAIHYSQDVLEMISKTSFSENYYFALTFKGAELVKTLLCFIDHSEKYIAALVHGIDYQIPREGRNLYNHIYQSVYKYMEENGLSIFDMGRGFVEHKHRMGADIIEPLYTYIQPISEEAYDYVDTLASASIGFDQQYRHLM
ncbi:hypothetical protein [Algicola sagamiensis]|uniref:hypothetical protein n=1 Tax=Algicola sagamiensis TaxID=163869 RepID=UPI0003AA26C1|nr:hypothetical protein [Algicola sagamiensis]